jgi:predicted nuclease with TOPRIM domain
MGDLIAIIVPNFEKLTDRFEQLERDKSALEERLRIADAVTTEAVRDRVYTDKKNSKLLLRLGEKEVCIKELEDLRGEKNAEVESLTSRCDRMAGREKEMTDTLAMRCAVIDKLTEQKAKLIEANIKFKEIISEYLEFKEKYTSLNEKHQSLLADFEDSVVRNGKLENDITSIYDFVSSVKNESLSSVKNESLSSIAEDDGSELMARFEEL